MPGAMIPRCALHSVPPQMHPAPHSGVSPSLGGVAGCAQVLSDFAVVVSGAGVAPPQAEARAAINEIIEKVRVRRMTSPIGGAEKACFV